MKIEEFDCVKIKRQGQERLYEKTKMMTDEEKLEFYRRSSEQLLALKAALTKSEAVGSHDA